MTNPKKNKPLSVLFTSSEADPFIKVGGLADVSGSLPKAMLELTNGNKNNRELDIRLVIPYHSGVRADAQTVTKVIDYFVPYGDRFYPTTIYETRIGALPVYLISSDWIRSSDRVYDLEVMQTARKYLFFSKAVSMLPEALDWPVQILHANDWHTALTIPLLQQKYAYPIKTLLTIHNLPFMGSETRGMLDRIGLEPIHYPKLPDWGGEIPLPIGSALANQVVAVSPTYAKEIMTPEFGYGLENFYSSIQSRVSGILNGLDLDLWNPQTDPYIQANYSSTDLSKREENKRLLQQQFALTKYPDSPLIVMISRFDNQKGIDLALQALRNLDHTPWQAIFLGNGSPTLEKAASDLAIAYPDRFHFENRFDNPLSHRLYAGGDIMLIPSRYEPCGLTQMIGMHYGIIPVARATGGLKDTISPFINNPLTATGFLFDKIDSDELTKVLQRALVVFPQKDLWTRLQLNAMNRDFSWKKSAAQYMTLYQNLEASAL